MIGRTDSSALLRAPGVAVALLGTAPAWLWDTENGRVLLASSAGIAFFGEHTLDALRQRDFGAPRPESAQLARICRTLPRDGTPRLSLLRLFVGFRDMPLPCQCRLVGERGEGLMLVVVASGGSKDEIATRAAALLDGLSDPAILRGESDEIFRNAAASGLKPGDGALSSAGTTVSLNLPDGDVDLILLGAGQDEGKSIAGADAVVPATAVSPVGAGKTLVSDGGSEAGPDAQPDEAADEAAAPAPAHDTGAAGAPRALPKTRRFTFLLDPDGRFVEVGAGFAALVGPQSANVIGRSWQELDGERHLDPDGALAGALATRDTWSDVHVEWPTDYGERAALRLSALPRFGEGRAFAGYRGFADVLDIVPAEGDQPTTSAGEVPETLSGTESDRAAAQAGARTDGHSSGAADLTVLEAERPKEKKGPSNKPRDAGSSKEKGDRPDAKIHRLHTAQAAPQRARTEQNGTLNDQERSAFKAIAAALGARWQGEVPEDDGVGTNAGGAPRNVNTLSRDVSDDVLAEEEAVDDADFEDAAGSALELSEEEAGSDSDWARGPLSAFPEHSLPETGSLDSLLQDVLDRVPLGLAVLRDEHLLMANRAFLDLFDYPDVDALEGAGGLGEALEGRGETNTGSTTAVVARRRDGSPICIEARLGRTPWIDGPAMLMSVREAREAIGDDVTEPALSAAELKAVVDAALDGVIVLDADAMILSANGGAERLLGIDAADLAGESFLDLIDEGGRDAVAEMLANLAASVPTLVKKGLDVTLDGADEPVDATLTLARLGTREPARFCAVLRDMTDWTEAEADLVAARQRAETASSQKSDFLAKMSHEIRTPLNGIIGFSEIMLEERFGPFGNDRYRDYIKDIRESGEHLMSLVNDLLDLSKVEAGKLDLSFTGVKLNDLAEQSVAIMQPQASKARVIVRTNLWPTLPAVVADVRSVRQVLLNLLSNAIKFTPPGGQVIVSTVLGESGNVFVRVRDTGPGMSESDVAVALEPFRQLPVTPTGGERGTGLGLPLAKALVEANRASFSLQSKVGDGTLVEICFPQSRVLSE